MSLKVKIDFKTKLWLKSWLWEKTIYRLLHCYFSSYLPTASNEAEGSHIHSKTLGSKIMWFGPNDRCLWEWTRLIQQSHGFSDGHNTDRWRGHTEGEGLMGLRRGRGRRENWRGRERETVWQLFLKLLFQPFSCPALSHTHTHTHTHRVSMFYGSFHIHDDFYNVHTVYSTSQP